MKRLPTAAALALLLVTAGVAGVVSADPNGTDYRTPTDGPTDAAVTADEAATVDVAATRADVTDATFEQRLARRLAHFDLTDAQVREIVTEASRLHEAGASRLVIRSSIVMNLYEFGVDAPFLYAGSGDGDTDVPADTHRTLHRFIRGQDVTPAQAREFHATVHRMYDAGATPEEIREAIRRMLAGYDDDVAGDDAPPDSVDRLVHRLVDRYGLDRQQAAEVERLIRGMLDDGADRTEIHEAVHRLLESYGVDHPTDDLARHRVTAARGR